MRLEGRAAKGESEERRERRRGVSLDTGEVKAVSDSSLGAIDRVHLIYESVKPT